MKKIDITKNFKTTKDGLISYPKNTYYYEKDGRLVLYKDGRNIQVYDIATGLRVYIIENCKFENVVKHLSGDMYERYIKYINDFKTYYEKQKQHYNKLLESRI